MSSDFSLIRDPDFHGGEWWHAAYAFKREMEGCGYGDDPLNQAWHFFKNGWKQGWSDAGGSDE